MIKMLLTASAAFLSIAGAQAAIVTYDNFADFTAAAGVTVLEDFNRQAIRGSFAVTPIDVGDFTVSRTPGGFRDPNSIARHDSDDQNVDFSIGLGFFNDPSTSTFLTFDGKITAFGADFKAFNNFDQSRIVINGIVLRPVPNGTSLSYYGFISDTPFDTVELRTLADGGSTDIAGLDNARYAFAAAVPEPANWALMISGFGLIGSAMRRRGGVLRTSAPRAGATR